MDVIRADEESENRTTFDKIQEYWLTGGKIELTPKQDEINKRWKTAFTLMENEGYLDKDVRKALVAYYNISEMQAYRDIKNAKLMFGNVTSIDMTIERYFALQSAKELLRTSKATNDLKSWGYAIKLIMEIAGFDSETMDAELYKKMQQHEIFINISDRDKQLLEQIAASGTFNFTKIMNDAQKIEYEHVSSTGED